jgi:hypothetical protein
VLKQTNPEIISILRSDSEVLERIQGSFHSMIRSRSQNDLQPIEITCFYEELPLLGIGVVSETTEPLVKPFIIKVYIRSSSQTPLFSRAIFLSAFIVTTWI